LEVARTASFTPAEWEAYERAKMAEQDARGALAIERQEGKAEGKAEGRAEGRAEGKAEGRLEGKRDTLLLLLAHRGITVSDEGRVKIAACLDDAMLDRWCANALRASIIDEVLR
jgi:predicted transposase YdaD